MHGEPAVQSLVSDLGSQRQSFGTVLFMLDPQVFISSANNNTDKVVIIIIMTLFSLKYK